MWILLWPCETNKNLNSRTCTKWQVGERHIFWPPHCGGAGAFYTQKEGNAEAGPYGLIFPERSRGRAPQRRKNETHRFVSSDCFACARYGSRRGCRSAETRDRNRGGGGGGPRRQAGGARRGELPIFERKRPGCRPWRRARPFHDFQAEIGRASCRERVSIPVGAESVNRKE